MQVVIAGGGPAGAMCARTLAKSGIRAIVIEASPRGRKPCAGGIPSILVKILHPRPSSETKNVRCDLSGPVRTSSARRFSAGAVHRNIDRQEFDAHLRWFAEDAGATVVEGG